MKGTTVYLCFAVIAAVGVSSASVGPTLDLVSREFSFSLTVAGLLLMTSSLGFLCASVAGGILSDRYGRRRFLMAALLCLATAGLLAGTAGNPAVLFVAFFIYGMALGGMEGMSTTVIADLSPGRQGMVINFSQVFFGIGALSGPLLAGVLLPHGWRLVYLAMAFPAVVLMVFLARQSLPRAAPAPADRPAGVRGVWRQPAFLLIALAMFLYVGAETGVASWLSFYMSRNLHASLFLAGLALSLFWAAIMAGRAVSGLIAERVGYERLVAVCSVMALVSLLLAVFSRDSLPAMLLFALTGLCYAAIWPTLMACAAARYAGSTGSVLGIIIAAGGLGSLVFPPLVGWTADRTSLAAAMGGTALLLPVITFAALTLEKRLPRIETLP